jgi:hypothetical protein
VGERGAEKNAGRGDFTVAVFCVAVHKGGANMAILPKDKLKAGANAPAFF